MDYTGIRRLARTIAFGDYLLKHKQCVISSEDIADIQSAVLSLPPREMQVLGLRYGMDGGKARSHKEIGGLLLNAVTSHPGVSASRVSQIEATAIRRLQSRSMGLKWETWLQDAKET